MRMKWLLFLLIMTGCRGKSGKQELIDRVNDPGKKITQQLRVGDVHVTAKWLPDSYRKIMIRDKDSSAGNETVSGEEEYIFFNVKFSKNAGEKFKTEKIMYLNFDMQNDFMLVKEKDTVPPAICQKIENGISGSYEYMLAFDKGKEMQGQEGFTLLYADKIFGIGTVAFVYDNSIVQKVPKLKEENGDD